MLQTRWSQPTFNNCEAQSLTSRRRLTARERPPNHDALHLLERSQSVYQQASDRLKAGIAATVEIVQAQQTVARADNYYINALFGHNLAKVALSRAMGQAEVTVQKLLRGQ